MAIKHKYQLEKYKGPSSRYPCPSCGSQKDFSRYIDSETGAYVHETVGRCNRENKCGYHKTPAEYFSESDTYENYKRNFTIKPQPVSAETDPSIPDELFNKSLIQYDHNNFHKWLISLFGDELTRALRKYYCIGTSNHWPGATVFWQIDSMFRVKAGKIMLYDESNGHRIKENGHRISWVHTVISIPGYKLKQCLFGEHLTNYSNKPVAIVESEKTAIIATVYFPQYIWLATGGVSNLNYELFRNISSRRIFLFPDLGAYEKWSRIARDMFSKILKYKVVVSDFLERHAPSCDKIEGLDLADYLIEFDYQIFNENPQTNLFEEILKRENYKENNLP